LFFALCSALQLRETQLSHPQELFEEFEKRLLFINKRFQFEQEHRVLEGILLGITPTGLLRIQVEEKEIQVANGEIKFLLP
jgi:biotin-(acetyl-CoA carboxylase) ligase